MNADLLAMLSGGGLGGAGGGGAGGRNPAEESGTELLRFKAGRMKAELQQVRCVLLSGANVDFCACVLWCGGLDTSVYEGRYLRACL